LINAEKTKTMVIEKRKETPLSINIYRRKYRAGRTVCLPRRDIK